MPSSTSPSRVPDRLYYVLEPGTRGLVTFYLHGPEGLHRAGAASLRNKEALGRLMKRSFLTGDDRRLLMRIYMANLPQQGNELQLTGKAAAGIIREIIGTTRCVWGPDEEIRPLRWSDTAWPGQLTWKVTGPESQQPVVEPPGGSGEPPEETFLVATAPLLAVNPAQGWVAEVDCGFPDGLASAWLGAGPMSSAETAVFIAELRMRFPEVLLPEPPTVRRQVREDVRPIPRFNIRPRDFYPRQMGERVHLYAGELSFDYLGHRVRYQAPAESVSLVEENELIEIRRDREFEDKEAQWLERLGLVPISRAFPGYELEDAKHDFTVPAGDDASWYRFLAETQADLEARGWVFRFEDQRHLAAALERDQYVQLAPSPKAGWFDIETGIRVEGQQVNLLPLIHSLIQKYHGRTPDQIRAEVEPRVFFVPTISGVTHAFEGKRFFHIVERLFELYDRDPFVEGERLRLSAVRAAELADAFGEKDELPGISPAVRKVAEILREGVTLTPAEEPPGLQAKLRDYQKVGLGWLQFLSRHEVNGVLADDMGLGKTLQTIAHLLTEKKAGRLDKPALLVAPTSLLRNWREEVERFAPELRVVTVHGNDRVILFRTFESVDLVLTTYGLIRRDAARHLEQEYSWVILDEAQFIKNPKSKVTEVLCKLNSRRRLCLSGTPMENHLGELWSLFHFLMPGFLGEADTFRRQFRIPIELDGNAAMRDVLMRRVRPFLLRRKKNEVARELPPKTEIHHPIEMTDTQWDIYESVRVAMHRRVQAEIAARGLARSQIVILDALTKLRQICCDPRLAKLKGREALTREHSAKLMSLMDMLPEMLREGSRILLFSQFTSMLSLIEAELRAAEIDFVTLTGRTNDRGQVVDAFQSGKVPLFLISLRAGGTGLNLTRADTVIHYDPWWNPAVENQATDRAYRIGQQNPVFVYKMVAENSVEEKIVAMQKKKAELAEGILSGAPGSKLQFDESDVASLLGE